MTTKPAPVDDRLVSARTVEALAGVAKSTIWLWLRKGLMPAPVRLSRRCTRWWLSEVLAWVKARQSPTPAAPAGTEPAGKKG